MAAPVVSGTVALMLQANPKLTPNLVKAILQYTAQEYPGYDSLRQGAGFLNSLGAVRLAKFYASNTVGSQMPVQSVWSKKILWGNHRISGGYINPMANAWGTSVVWGAARALRWRQHHLGHRLQFVRQHHLGHRRRRIRQHHLGHELRHR